MSIMKSSVYQIPLRFKYGGFNLAEKSKMFSIVRFFLSEIASCFVKHLLYRSGLNSVVDIISHFGAVRKDPLAGIN